MDASDPTLPAEPDRTNEQQGVAPAETTMSLKRLFARAERSDPAVDEPRELQLARVVLSLTAERDRLAALVAEMLPVFVDDVTAGLALGEPPAGHVDDCDDCVWYRTSLERKARLDAGEFTLSPEVLERSREQDHGTDAEHDHLRAENERLRAALEDCRSQLAWAESPASRL